MSAAACRVAGPAVEGDTLIVSKGTSKHLLMLLNAGGSTTGIMDAKTCKTPKSRGESTWAGIYTQFNHYPTSVDYSLPLLHLHVVPLKEYCFKPMYNLNS